ncbi:MAG: Efflux transporter, family, subunit [Pedosphaera sp.]|nr:Efflux transporter, family, subunit [Pedosphaera sp.]
MLIDNEIQNEKRPPMREIETRMKMEGPKSEPKKSSKAIWVTIGALCLVVALAVWGVKRRQAAAAQAGARTGQPPVPVLAGTVEQKDVPIYLDGLGTVQAFNTVTVHVRVDGQLKKVAFTEGQDVHAGDLLAQIDPDPFQTALNQAISKKGQDEAQLINAQIGLKRETELVAAKIDAQQVYDTQKALADQLDAAVKADQAAIESAQVQLNYTTVTSPIDGRTGIRQVDQGNIVHATDSNGLVVITQLKPISVVFTLPEQNLDAIHQEMSKNGDGLKVLAVGPDDTTVLDEGDLAVIDNQIDPTTGTIKLKGTFPNSQLRLWPGQFVNTRLLLTTHKDGLVVPAMAIQRGPTGAYVFVIEKGKGGRGHAGNTNANAGAQSANTNASASAGENNPNAAKSPGSGGKPGAGGNQEILSVKIQPVTVASEVTGPEALITSGLQKGERIVVDGQYKLQDGSRITIAQPGQTNNVEAGPKDSMQ